MSGMEGKGKGMEGGERGEVDWHKAVWMPSRLILR
jgi:hypothetical protein